MLVGCLFVLSAVITSSAGVVAYKKFSKNRKYIFLVFTIFFMLLAPVSSFNALQYLSIDIVYMATSLNGIIVSFFSSFYLKETITPNQILGSVFVFIGVVLYMV